VPRDEVFVTTKFYPGARDPAAEAEKSLRRLGIQQLDLYIIHWPQGGPTWAWPGMEEARRRGHARSIGVSNFDVGELDAACEERGIVLEAYSPLTTGARLEDPRLAEVASRHGRTPAQVLLRWCIQRGTPTIPKSTRRERIEENAQTFDFELSDEDMAALDGLDETGGTSRALERKWW
jgi:diketogulonate reductase-like aldo/keto reductase